MKYFILAALYFIGTNTFAQNTIKGKITDESNRALSDVSVKLDSLRKTKTDADGAYNIGNIPDGKYTIAVKLMGYVTKEVEVELSNKQVSEVNVVLARNTKKLKDAVVKTSVKKESINAIISFQKNNLTVSDGVSAEAIKRTPDRNVSDVLKRASGLSIQGDKFAVVRGMDGRYVNAMINSSLVPSTEPDKKAFAFDLLPANIIDNIIITKAAVPELSAEFAGGLINVNIKDGVDKPFFNAAIGTGFNSQTLGKNFNRYNGSSTDFLGYDNGVRSLQSNFPSRNDYLYNTSMAQKVEISKTFNDIWSYQSSSLSTPNLSLQLNGGRSFMLGGKKLSSIAALSYSNNYRTLNFDNIFINPGKDTLYSYKDVQNSNKVQLGALANFSYNVGKNSKITFKNLFNLNANDQTTTREGKTYFSDNNIKNYELFFVSNRLYNAQLNGEHKIKKIDMKVHWGLNYSNIHQSTPDRRVMQYTQDVNSPNDPYTAFITTTASPIYAGRFYSKLNENLYSFKLDLVQKYKLFGFEQGVKVGTYLQERDRLFDVRNIGMAAASIATYTNPNINFADPAEQLFSLNNIATNGFIVEENTNAVDAYKGKARLNAFYIQSENQFSEKMKLVWGLRDESFSQSIHGVFVDSEFVSTTKNDLLPSAVLTYSPNKKINVRVCASQTVVRPEFRELAPFQFYDFERNSYVVGNSTLQRSKINNFDIRYERYPAAGEMFVVGAFYKFFNNPIQPNLDVFSGGTFVRSFYNAVSCTNYGLEAEFRKKLDKLSKLDMFKEGSVFANFTYTKSKVVKTNDASVANPNTQLVNQSPFIANLGYSYLQSEFGWGFTASYNLLTRRISEVGVSSSNIPDIIEATRNVLDAQISYRFKNNKSELKLNGGDLLNQKNRFFMDVNNNYKYDAGLDYLVFNKTLGRNFSVQYSYKF